MSKRVFIAEKPSVAREFANSLGLSFKSKDGYMEAEDTIVTWCVGHLVTMCYPDAYDPKYKKWSLSTIPFIPDKYRYQVIDGVKKQFGIVKRLLTDKEVDTIYICTDSGREGEYIYRLVAQEAGVQGKRQLRVWIDSQTKEEILRGIKEAKDDSEYDNLGSAAYLRAKEDYLMGINFSRALTLKYGDGISRVLGTKYSVIAVGRVMTCVLGMVVRREREIRDFVKTPFYRVLGNFRPSDNGSGEEITAEWHAAEGSRYFGTSALYKENGFRERKDAEELIRYLQQPIAAGDCDIRSVNRKKEKKNPPLLYNLAELQNDCSRFFKISPDQTLQAAQELYEKKLTTYPRTDARVLSSAVAKEIGKNLKGLSTLSMYRPYLKKILETESYKKIAKTRYTDDKAITDHYAIIPTGQGLNALPSLKETTARVYELICRRFLAIFYPPAIFDKISLEIRLGTEMFSASFKTCVDPGYLEVMDYSFRKKKEDTAEEPQQKDGEGNEQETDKVPAFVSSLRKSMKMNCTGLEIKEGETKPPKRYNSGSMILAMENAGQLIEEEELREQIRGSGIGTSATRAEILKKLFSNRYLALNKKTQVITPTLMGEMIYDTVDCSIRSLLNPKLTASWELGLTRVSEGSVSEEEYLDKLNGFVSRNTNNVKNSNFSDVLQQMYMRDSQFYKKPYAPAAGGRKKTGRKGN
ncbi:MAG: type IA DNA topoisomerase [Lachnospiraceae bacterium]|nr:type IA DNA topoisomerase [Lachnospiraceae bacterium]MBQ8330615.1 type IA DNA topoisomerase [Lachnospiraceae bacterium]